jgi:hypothetical protein
MGGSTIVHVSSAKMHPNFWSKLGVTSWHTLQMQFEILAACMNLIVGWKGVELMMWVQNSGFSGMVIGWQDNVVGTEG